MNKAQATISAVIKYRGKCKSFVLERVPIGWNHPIDKNSLQINKLEHVLIEKIDQFFRNML